MVASDEDRGVVICDLYGCGSEIPVPPESHPVDHVEDHPDWHHRDGLFRCPAHPFRPKWAK